MQYGRGRAPGEHERASLAQLPGVGYGGRELVRAEVSAGGWLASLRVDPALERFRVDAARTA